MEMEMGSDLGGFMRQDGDGDGDGVSRRWGSSGGAEMGCSLRFRGKKKKMNWGLVRARVFKMECSLRLGCN